jgi:hypothetical protein
MTLNPSSAALRELWFHRRQEALKWRDQNT